MIPVKQTRFFYGTGNCFQAALASVLEVSDPEQIPYFQDHDDQWFVEFQRWMIKHHGLYPIIIDLENSNGFQMRGYHLIQGQRDDCPHTVVGKDGEQVFDPMIGGSGLDEVWSWVIFVKVL